MAVNDVSRRHDGWKQFEHARALQVKHVQPGVHMVWVTREGWDRYAWCAVLANAVMSTLPHAKNPLPPSLRLLLIEPVMGIFTLRFKVSDIVGVVSVV